MRILIVHNAYQRPGGEDAVFHEEKKLLSGAGHQVSVYTRNNQEINGFGIIEQVLLPLRTVWAGDSVTQIQEILQRDRPEIAHFHNTFPLISPGAYYACARAGVSVVQTLHNYRLLCPAATFLRNGVLCERCLGRAVPSPGVVHRCYRRSLSSSVAAAGMLAFHKVLHTWQDKVDIYIALSEFAREKFIQGGLPADRIVVKPNFVEVDLEPRHEPGDYALYVGRLSEEKGLRVLLAAWEQIRKPIPLLIAGDGPLGNEIQDNICRKRLTAINLLGQVAPETVVRLLRGARFLIFPSVWYETFGLAIVEAFACGVPVIASRLGSMEEIVTDGRSGLHFSPGDPVDLASKVEWAWSHAEELSRMGGNARAEYEEKYNRVRGYENLMAVYQQALQRRSQDAEQ
jgi:glycosyltransferase involved in cell wall biosynthesis